MQSEFAIKINDVGKCYPIFDKPVDRLKQALLRGRKKFYKEFWALNGVSIDIRKGETVGIIGSNGSGKSTLLQLICGTVKPTMGSLQINGRVSALLELGAGFNPEFTGRENVYLNAAVMGLSKEETETRFDDISSFAAIGDFLDRPVKTYSSGMYVRLAFAVAVNVFPDILLVDEALSVGDARFQQKCMTKIRKFCESGTVVFVSHDTSALTELCSRAIWLDHGKIIMDDIPKPVVEKYLQFMYEGDLTPQIALEEPLAYQKKKEVLAGFIPVNKGKHQFGDKRAVIEYVRFRSGHMNSGGVAYADEKSEISIVIRSNKKIDHPIVGYLVKDHLGREIFGDNTALMKKSLTGFLSGNRYLVTFKLATWPNICAGEYVISLAVADGTIEDHVQCHWAYDALVVKSIPIRPPVGLFSVPHTHVELQDI